MVSGSNGTLRDTSGSRYCLVRPTLQWICGHTPKVESGGPDPDDCIYHLELIATKVEKTSTNEVQAVDTTELLYPNRSSEPLEMRSGARMVITSMMQTGAMHTSSPGLQKVRGQNTTIV